MKKMTLCILLFLMVCGGSAYAFQDVPAGTASDKLAALQEQGIVSGMGNGKFEPQRELTYAQGIYLIVNGMSLNIDNLRFIKKPEASDYYEHVADDAWYASAFIIAQFRLQLPQDIHPDDPMTREAYTHYLFTALAQKGNFIFPELYMLLEDENEVDPAYMLSIQNMLIANLVSTDENTFHPKAPMIRIDAAIMLYDTMQYVEDHHIEPPVVENPDEPVSDDEEGEGANGEPGEEAVARSDVNYTLSKVNDSVNMVTIDWGEQSNSGYGITIERIDFTDDNKAVITYELHYPDPDRMYLQVITYPKAQTFIASEYEISLKAK